jgi:hypothetical protein
LLATSFRKATGKEEAVPEKPTKYQERIRVLREQAKEGSMRAMQELHKKYHISQIMINGELVNLKERFRESMSRY